MRYTEIESERLRFRKLEENDIPSWVEFFDNNDRLDFLGLDLTKSKEELADGWIRSQFDRYEKTGLGHLAAITKERGEFIGLGGVIPRMIDVNNEYEIAYSLKPKYWGKGYGTEVAQTMKTFAQKYIDAERFISIIDINNKESIRVAVKNGMSVLFRTEYLGMLVDVYGIKNE